ncbi:LD-carboxypeptidase [Sutcliffiella horikoshii]|uniref:LD-carboxypeptidase n=1 Tax=Sutcliffiella horikoshii TaxID=79883 RepID=A0A5D4SWM9_9BACI|nr:LD-carboxypeptidase [Sutcliffiella horikoshii]TYS67780.1 LD-carboxypeptidase [Sutcliffiella horikoshii]
MEKIKPKRLQKGDTIGIVAPASPHYNRSDIIRGIETLEEWGFRVVVGENVHNKHEYLAGTDEERAHDFNEMFRNDQVDAVFVTQGGYGSARMLRYIDFELVRNNPKIFIGYSDITSIHLAIQKYTGLVSFHGPGMAGFNSEDLTDYRKEFLFKALMETEPIGEIRKANEKKWINQINKGEAEGELVGGNLTLVCASLGTPYEIDTKGKILFLEEVWSEPWNIDHMFTHLLHAGKLQEAAGIVIGECTLCEPKKMDPGFHVTFSLEDILYDFIEPLGIPAIHGLPIGHTEDLATLPMGVNAYLDATNKKLFVTESGVK